MTDTDMRHPATTDGLALHDLIRRCPPLDLNSAYAYQLLVHHHRSCCVVVDSDNHGGLMGAVTAYRLPEDETTLFIWQVAVDASARGLGLATRMLSWLISTQKNLRWIQTTIGPDNTASQRTFQRLARQLDIPIQSRPFLDGKSCGSDHEPEDLYTLGPLKP